MPGFGDYETALQTRTVLVRMIESVVNRIRPETRLAEVYSFDHNTMTADVLLTGDTVPIRVKYHRGQKPIKVHTDTASGSFVRVAGKQGNYYIIGVLDDYVLPPSGGKLGPLAGPWAAGVPANSTTGTTFTVGRSGKYLMTCEVSGWSSTIEARTFGVWIDGGVGGLAQAYKTFMFNYVNAHAELGRTVWTQELTAGTHYFYVQYTGSSDALDFATLTWTAIE